MPGESRVDPHVKVLDKAVVRRATARGLDALVYAPHFVRLPEIRARADRYSDDELVIVPAREVFAGSWRERTHVLALGLADPVPDFLTLEATMAELASQQATVLVPHPEFATVSLSQTDVERHRDLVAGVETYNPKHLARHNRRAQAIVRETGIPPFASSYAHLPGTVGEVWTAFDRSLDSPGAVLAALGSDANRRIGHRSGIGHRLRRAAEIGHLFYENGPSKAALLARGPKPTNPYHPAYPDRFQADAVYGRPQVRSFD